MFEMAGALCPENPTLPKIGLSKVAKRPIRVTDVGSID